MARRLGAEAIRLSIPDLSCLVLSCAVAGRPPSSGGRLPQDARGLCDKEGVQPAGAR